MGHPRAWVLAAVLVAVATPACSREQRSGVPAACRQGEQAVREALRDAPGEVRLDGTPLSACLADESDAAELADVGAAFVGAASALGDAAAERPAGAEAEQLGYLVGAARRGVRDHRGVNAELVRRIEQESLPVANASETFRRGERAGRRGG